MMHGCGKVRVKVMVQVRVEESFLACGEALSKKHGGGGPLSWLGLGPRPGLWSLVGPSYSWGLQWGHLSRAYAQAISRSPIPLPLP